MINNLGSLAARFIFLPIEDSGYLFFSQTLHRGVAASTQTGVGGSKVMIKNKRPMGLGALLNNQLAWPWAKVP